MNSEISFDHPKQKLLFYVVQDFGENLPPVIEQEVERIARSRDWVIAPPIFMDEIHASNLGTPVRTVGGVLEIYSAWPPWELPIDVDQQHLEEVTFLIESLRQFSAKQMVAIEFELAGTYVGAVTDGQINRALSETFLGEWRRHLEKKIR